jgi:hypothetical protein
MWTFNAQYHRWQLTGSLNTLVSTTHRPIKGDMYGNWAERLNGQQRAVHAIATVIALTIASSMFFSIKAATAIGGEYDCGPAAYALVAGPTEQDAEQGDCHTAASKRLTTVAGLIVLTVIGSQIGVRLTRTPRPTQPRNIVRHTPPVDRGRPQGPDVIAGGSRRIRGHQHAE